MNIMGILKEETGVRKNIYLLAIIIIMIASGVIISQVINGSETYLVKEEEIEYTSICTAFVLKEEGIIEINSGKIFVPIISEGGRVAKNEIIATYRGAEYEEYVSRLEEMDNEIAEVMKDIGIVYSTELQNLDTQVTNTIKSAQGESSYSNIQECNNLVRKLFCKRAELIGEYSPDGAHIKGLIQKRNEYEKASNNSNDNIKATATGLITYTIDGLEEDMSMNKIDKLNYEDLKTIIKGKKESVSSIKIVNNYEAYVMVKVTDVDEAYVNLGQEYCLRIMDSELNEFMGTLVRKNNADEDLELTFKVTNGIENLFNLRETEIEIVWETYKGLVIPNKAIKTDGDNTYVTILYGGEYIDVMVSVEKKTNKYSVVSNVKDDNRKTEYKLERYDQILIEDQK